MIAVQIDIRFFNAWLRTNKNPWVMGRGVHCSDVSKFKKLFQNGILWCESICKVAQFRRLFVGGRKDQISKAPLLFGNPPPSLLSKSSTVKIRLLVHQSTRHLLHSLQMRQKREKCNQREQQRPHKWLWQVCPCTLCIDENTPPPLTHLRKLDNCMHIVCAADAWCVDKMVCIFVSLPPGQG